MFGNKNYKPFIDIFNLYLIFFGIPKKDNKKERKKRKNKDNKRECFIEMSDF